MKTGLPLKIFCFPKIRRVPGRASKINLLSDSKQSWTKSLVFSTAKYLWWHAGSAPNVSRNINKTFPACFHKFAIRSQAIWWNSTDGVESLCTNHPRSVLRKIVSFWLPITFLVFFTDFQNAMWFPQNVQIIITALIINKEKFNLSLKPNSGKKSDSPTQLERERQTNVMKPGSWKKKKSTD